MKYPKWLKQTYKFVNSLYTQKHKKLLCIWIMIWAMPQILSADPLHIDSMIVTPSYCQNNGTLEVFSSGGDSSASYQYSLDTLGSNTYQWSSSGVFNSLYPGQYLLTVQDVSGQQVTQNVTITGQYTPPSINSVTTTEPNCPGGSDASLEILYTAGTRPDPFFTLYDSAGSTLVAGPQLSPIFTGLSAGKYTCQIQDSCGIMANYIATISDKSLQPLKLKITQVEVDCDSSLVRLVPGYASYPVTYTISTVGQSGTPMILSSSSSSLDIMLANQNTQVVITDACGRQYTATQDLTTIQYTAQVVSDSCGYIFQFKHTNFACDSIVYGYKLVADSIWTYSTVDFTPILSPGLYEYKIINTCCNQEYTGTRTILPTDTSVITEINHGLYNCVDSTSAIRASFKNAHNLKVVFKGPAFGNFTGTADNNAQTFTPLIQLDDTLNTYIQSTYEEFYLVNVPLGTYHFEYWDDCRPTPKQLTIVVDSVKDYNPFADVMLGCPGDNKIKFGMGSGDHYTRGNIKLIDTATQNTLYFTKTYGRDTFEINSLPSGDYILEYNFTGTNKSAYNKVYSCPNTLTKSVHIAPYQNPSIVANHLYNCTDGTSTAVALPQGNSPWTYSIRQKGSSQFLSTQNTNIFTGLDSTMIYEIEATDACGNNAVVEISDETPLANTPTYTSTDCMGTAGTATYVTLSTDHILGAMYRWTDSTGTVLSTTTEYHMSPIVAGQYSVHVDIPGSSGVCLSDSADIAILSDMCDGLQVSLTALDWDIRMTMCEATILFNPEQSDIVRVWVEGRQKGQSDFETLYKFDLTPYASDLPQYSYTDNSLVAGETKVYRLKALHSDGTYSYTSTREIMSDCDADHMQDLTLYPNPADHQALVSVSSSLADSDYTLELVDITGRTIRSLDMHKTQHSTTISIDVSDLASGNFLVILRSADGQIQAQKVLLVN